MVGNNVLLFGAGVSVVRCRLYTSCLYIRDFSYNQQRGNSHIISFIYTTYVALHKGIRTYESNFPLHAAIVKEK